MLGFLKRLFGKKPDVREFSEEEIQQDYEAKTAALERLLGPMHDEVGHAIIPYQVGGTVDMYYFTQGVAGTAFATMELINPDGKGPRPNRVGTYELVAFTKHPYRSGNTGESPPPAAFNAIERRICGIFTTIGHYSTEAVLNPADTSRIPMGDDQEDICLVFDEYRRDGIGFEYNGRRHCLLLCIEVFDDEMEFAREHGSRRLLEKLKNAGHYPYSDLDRQSVV